MFLISFCLDWYGNTYTPIFYKVPPCLQPGWEPEVHRQGYTGPGGAGASSQSSNSDRRAEREIIHTMIKQRKVGLRSVLLHIVQEICRNIFKIFLFYNHLKLAHHELGPITCFTNQHTLSLLCTFRCTLKKLAVIPVQTKGQPHSQNTHGWKSIKRIQAMLICAARIKIIHVCHTFPLLNSGKWPSSSSIVNNYAWETIVLFSMHTNKLIQIPGPHPSISDVLNWVNSMVHK